MLDSEQPVAFQRVTRGNGRMDLSFSNTEIVHAQGRNESATTASASLRKRLPGVEKKPLICGCSHLYSCLFSRFLV